MEASWAFAPLRVLRLCLSDRRSRPFSVFPRVNDAARNPGDELQLVWAHSRLSRQVSTSGAPSGHARMCVPATRGRQRPWGQGPCDPAGAPAARLQSGAAPPLRPRGCVPARVPVSSRATLGASSVTVRAQTRRWWTPRQFAGNHREMGFCL